MNMDQNEQVLQYRIRVAAGPWWKLLPHMPQMWWEYYQIGRGDVWFWNRARIATHLVRIVYQLATSDTSRMPAVTKIQADETGMMDVQRQPAHMHQPLTKNELRFLSLLLADGDKRAVTRQNLPASVAPRDLRLGQPISTPAARAALERAQSDGPPLTTAELALIADQVDACGDLVSGCISEAMPSEAFTLFTREEQDAMQWAQHIWNGDPEEYQPGIWYDQGWIWMHYYAAKCRVLAERQLTNEGVSYDHPTH